MTSTPTSPCTEYYDCGWAGMIDSFEHRIPSVRHPQIIDLPNALFIVSTFWIFILGSQSFYTAKWRHLVQEAKHALICICCGSFLSPSSRRKDDHTGHTQLSGGELAGSPLRRKGPENYTFREKRRLPAIKVFKL